MLSERLLELGMRAGDKKAMALKNLIFALLFCLCENQLRYEWQTSGVSLEETDESFLCLRSKQDHSRVLKMPAYRLSGGAGAFLMYKALREPDGGMAPARRRVLFSQLFRFRFFSAEGSAEPTDPEIEQLWQELLLLVGSKEVKFALKWMNLNRVQLEEVYRHVPQASAA